MDCDPLIKRLSVLVAVALGLALTFVVMPPTEGAVTTTAGQAAAIRCHGQIATIVGTAGSDQLVGTPRRDVIAGLGGRDFLLGKGGDDLICAGKNVHSVNPEGDPVSEYVTGGAGDDRLFGGGGRDELVGGRGYDFLYGGSGEDWLVGVDRERDFNRGGLDHMFGGDGDDSLTARTVRGVLHGGDGDDRLRGDNGADRLYGDAGDDVLAPDAGDDLVDGGDGPRDVVDYTMIINEFGMSTHTDPLEVDLARGVAYGSRFGTDRLQDVEGAWTGDGDDTLIGDEQDNFFFAGYGDHDTVDGGPGRDLLTFDSATIVGFCCVPVTLDLATGSGNTRAPNGGSTLLQVTDIEDVEGSGAADTLLGDAGPNTLSGGKSSYGYGDDTLDGREGNDILIGSSDDDTLQGGAGDDQLFGNFGDDMLDGGTGVDLLDGGPGIDSCVNWESSAACE